MILGVLLPVFAARQWRGRGEKRDEGGLAGWISKLDEATAVRAAALAVVFAVVKPKNLLLTIGAGMAVAQVGAAASGQVIAIGVFVMLGTAGLALPLSIHVLMRVRGELGAWDRPVAHAVYVRHTTAYERADGTVCALRSPGCGDLAAEWQRRLNGPQRGPNRRRR